MLGGIVDGDGDGDGEGRSSVESIHAMYDGGEICWALAIEAGDVASVSFVDVNMKVKVAARVSTLTLR